MIWLLIAAAHAAPLSCETVRDMVDAGVPMDDVAALVETEGVLVSDLSCVGSIVPLAPKVVTFDPYDRPYMLRENPYTDQEACDTMRIPSPMTAALASWTFGFGAGHYYAGSVDSGILLTAITLGTVAFPYLVATHPDVSDQAKYNAVLRGIVSHVVVRAVDAGTAGVVAHYEREELMLQCPGPVTR